VEKDSKTIQLISHGWVIAVMDPAPECPDGADAHGKDYGHEGGKYQEDYGPEAQQRIQGCLKVLEQCILQQRP
jgi:hypothetical protein